MKRLREKVLLQAVVVFVIRDGKVLLAEKINKNKEEIKIGEGVWNGFGGGREPGETIKEAAVREMLEETRKNKESKHGLILTAEQLNLRAVVYCHNLKKDGRKFKCKLYVFVAADAEGIIEDSDEMVNATWFPIAQLQELPMIPSDADWIPEIFGDKVFVARVFLRDSQTVKTSPTQIRQVSRLSCD